mgnify:CR=1 FL=1
MQSFSTPGSNGNNVWTVQITVATIKRVQALVGVNLLDVLDSKSHLLEKLSTDPILLCDVLYAICKDQVRYLISTGRSYFARGKLRTLPVVRIRRISETDCLRLFHRLMTRLRTQSSCTITKMD